MGESINENVVPITARNGENAGQSTPSEPIKNSSRPSAVQVKYLERGINQAGGKLPLFDENGQLYSAKTIKACIVNGWAIPWFNNPAKPDWLVCKLTEQGREVIK